MSIRPKRTKETHGTSNSRTANAQEDSYADGRDFPTNEDVRQGLQGGAAKLPSRKHGLLESTLSHGVEKSVVTTSRIDRKRRHDGKHEMSSAFEKIGHSKSRPSRLETSVFRKHLRTSDYPSNHVVEVRRYPSPSQRSGRPTDSKINKFQKESLKIKLKNK